MIRRQLIFVATASVLLASCGDSPLPPEPPLQCQIVVSQTSSNPPSSDPSPLPGSPVGALTDDFAGSVVNSDKWSFYDDASRTSQDDRLVVAVTPSAGYGGLSYRLPHRFAGSSFSAEVSRAASGGNLVETVVGIATPDDEEYILLTSFGATLQAVYNWRDRGCNDPSHVRSFRGWEYCLLGSVAFDATAHRFRRLREQNGTVFLELSADGQSWLQPANWSLTHHFADAGQLHGLLSAGTPDPYPSTTSAYFENVNTTVPAIPRGLGASCIGRTAVQLTWERHSVNETGFRIERRQGTGAFAEIGGVGANATTFTSSGLQPGTTYEYRIRATNANGNSGYSRTVSVTM
jgi:hypothetical protein